MLSWSTNSAYVVQNLFLDFSNNEVELYRQCNFVSALSFQKLSLLCSA